MNQYTVLLVDDEEEVFQVIMKKLDWESMGFSIAGYARNGVEALEMAEELQPDVVMTDIKMPYMDGLTLCKKLKELYQKVKVIIFSGFDEFEYAKEAIKIEAEEYILKPINSNELREVFERIKVNLDKELDEKRNIDKLREYYMESLPVLQENFYTSLIEGRIPESQIEKYVQNYQINLTGPYYVVTVLHISTTNPENVPIDPFLLTVSVKKLAMEQLTRLAAQMQSRTSDLMNTEVSAIMDAITDGKYNRLWVDENLHVQLMSNGKKISMDQVSRGTLEQIYFAIRMAATKILHEEECPVILDDAFGYYDDRRLAQTLRWLKDSKRQVIIFSCQKREMEMLEKMRCVYHKVML